MPELRESDAWVVTVWQEMASRLGQGAPIDVLRFRCEAAGMTAPAEQLEAWERVQLVEATVTGFMRALAEAGRG